MQVEERATLLGPCGDREEEQEAAEKAGRALAGAQWSVLIRAQQENCGQGHGLQLVPRHHTDLLSLPYLWLKAIQLATAVSPAICQPDSLPAITFHDTSLTGTGIWGLKPRCGKGLGTWLIW